MNSLRGTVFRPVSIQGAVLSATDIRTLNLCVTELFDDYLDHFLLCLTDFLHMGFHSRCGRFWNVLVTSPTFLTAQHQLHAIYALPTRAFMNVCVVRCGVCLFLCVCACLRVHVCMCVMWCVSVCLHVCMCVMWCVSVCLHVCMLACACVYVCDVVCVCWPTCMYACDVVCVCLPACMYACVRTCVTARAHTCVWYTLHFLMSS